MRRKIIALLAGFVMAYEERHLNVPENIIYENIVKDEELEKAIDKALSENVECLMCMDDTICSFTLRKLERQRIEVPQQVSVAAFYNNSILEKHIPSVTSLEFDARKLGSVCGEILLQHIEGQSVEKITMLDYRIFEGESTKVTR